MTACDWVLALEYAALAAFFGVVIWICGWIH